MAYEKNIWVDQQVERPKTYEMTNNSDGSVTLIDSFGLVTELGTPVNADNMNHIEDGIADHEDRITLLEEGADTSDYVQKSGDTMTGILNFKQSDTFDYTDTNHTTAAETSGNISFKDKNNMTCGSVSNYFNQYNNLVTRLTASREIGGVVKTADLSVYVDKDGNPIVTAPASAVANSIVTTTGISKASNGYVKLGNGIIINWGSCTSAQNTAKTATFALSFTSTNYKLCLTQNSNNQIDQYANTIYVSTRTATNFTYSSPAKASVTWHWIAVGY